MEPPRAIASPAYRIDLRSDVEGPFAFIPIGPLGESRVGLPIRSLRFLDNQRLAATVVTQAPGAPALPKRGQPSAASRFRLHVVLFEAEAGKILATPSWPSNTRYAWVVAATNTGFVTETGNELTLVSPELKPIKRLTLADPGADRRGHELWWDTNPSWSERRAVLVAGLRSPWLWIDTEKLQVTKSWQDDMRGGVAVSDDQLVMMRGGPPSESPAFLALASPGGSWKPLPGTANTSLWQFVGPDLLYFHRFATDESGVTSSVFLMRTDTGGLSRLEPPRNRNWGLGQAAVSRDGKRFVILVEQTKGAHPGLDISGHDVLRALLVFDLPFKTPSFTLEVRGSRIRNPNISALSPDGRHLAVFADPDPVVEVYDLPPPK